MQAGSWGSAMNATATVLDDVALKLSHLVTKAAVLLQYAGQVVDYLYSHLKCL